jgi:hypothetical protein
MVDLAEIRNAVADLWDTPPDNGESPSTSRAFPPLLAACKTLNSRIEKHGDHALENALRAIGAPWMSVGNVRPLPPSPEEVAQRIAAALVATHGRRVHLCPLDGADNLPRWSFGNSRVVKLSPSELDALVSPSRLLRHHARWVFDSRTFSQFQWLVVNEEVPLDPDPAIRAWPLLGKIVGDVDGRIVPHAARLPPVVEDALFALLLLPWEEVVEHAEYDWRPFRVPWVYTIDEDLFASPKAPPDPTSLRWKDVTLTGADGEVIYDERPDVWSLELRAVEAWPPLDDGSWQRLQVARRSELLTRPVAHFLVRAFLADEIDEFLTHITTIEAALALPRDHNPGARPKLPDGTSRGATHRLALRVGNLLGSEAAGEKFRALYRARSDFLHGAAMQDIPAAQRLGARHLARRVSEELIRRGADDAQLEREPFLASLCP